MATAAELATYRRTTNDVVSLAYREIAAFWTTLDTADARGALRALEAFLPEVVRAYGEVGAAAASDFYDDLRERSPAARRAYAAVMGEAVPLEQVRASSRWAGAPLFGASPDPDKALARVTALTDRLVKAQARGTILTNVARDPSQARYARVPRGETCAFCLMLASRGATYASRESAVADDYHDLCNCEPVPVWDPTTDFPEGYDPEALRETYTAARVSGSGSLKGSGGTLSTLRSDLGVR